MQPKKILSNLDFKKEIQSKRQTYYIYEGNKNYVLMTVNRKRNSCNFNIVSKEAIEYVKKYFKRRKKISVSDILNESKKPTHIKERFDALNILYALCATGDARIDTRFKGNQLFFNIKWEIVITDS